MDCSQVLPGAVNPGPCSIAAGYYYDNPFIVSFSEWYRTSGRPGKVKSGDSLRSKVRLCMHHM